MSADTGGEEIGGDILRDLLPALSFAARWRHLDVLQAMIEHGVDVNAAGECGRTAKDVRNYSVHHSVSFYYTLTILIPGMSVAEPPYTTLPATTGSM